MLLNKIRSLFSKKDNIKNEFITKGGSAGFLNVAASLSPVSVGGYGGDKTNFLNGFGLTYDLRVIDLRLLQFRSLQLFRENSFVSSIFSRLETKVINSGLRLRCAPVSEILLDFISEEDLQEWSGKTERLFEVWSKDKRLIEKAQKYNFADLQRLVYRTALLSGDCLVIMSVNKLGLPSLEIVDGINICSPALMQGKNIVTQGVELDDKGTEIAYHVKVDAMKFKRVKAKSNAGTRRAWLVKASTTRIDDVRGLPVLSVVLQNLNEIGKYMDSEQRAALVNSYIAVVHTASEKAPLKGTPFVNAKLSKDDVSTQNGDSSAEFAQMQPGWFGTKLAPGEQISSFDTSRPNVNMSGFVEFCLKSAAHSLEIPPEILFLEYGSSFSASRQAKNDFNDFILKATSTFASNFTQVVFNEWLTGMILGRKITAPGYMDSLLDINQWEVLGAWRNSVWRGLPNTSVDILKQVKALEIIEDRGYQTAEQIADEYFGTDYNANQRIRKKELENRPVIDENTTAIAALSKTMNDFIDTFEVNA